MQQNILQLGTTQAGPTIVPNQLKTTVCLDREISHLTNQMGTIRICGFFFPMYGAWDHRKSACWPLRFVLLYLGYYSAISMLWEVNTSDFVYNTPYLNFHIFMKHEFQPSCKTSQQQLSLYILVINTVSYFVMIQGTRQWIRHSSCLPEWTRVSPVPCIHWLLPYLPRVMRLRSCGLPPHDVSCPTCHALVLPTPVNNWGEYSDARFRFVYLQIISHRWH